MRKQFIYNTLRPKGTSVILEDEVLRNAKVSDLVSDVNLNTQICNDLEFGVGNRPSLPSCFDDDDFWKEGKVDRLTDIRRSPWDDLADACNPVNVTQKDSEPVKVEPVEPVEPVNVE